MAGSSIGDIDPKGRRKVLAAAVARTVLTIAALVTLYYVMPVHEAWRLASGLRLLATLALFSALLVWQIRKILNAKHPGVRAIEALAVTVPIFLLLFAGTYYLMSVYGAGNFNQDDLTRTDTLYFTVTVFSTVGFGDITATSETARLVVTLQMILDLVILGVGINALLHAAKVGRERQAATDEAGGRM